MVKICAYCETSPDQTVGAVFLDGFTLTAKVLPGWERGMTNVFNDPASFMVNGKRVIVARTSGRGRPHEMQPTVWDGSRFYATMVRPGKEDFRGKRLPLLRRDAFLCVSVSTFFLPFSLEPVFAMLTPPQPSAQRRPSRSFC
jgi:hypothetical protein